MSRGKKIFIILFVIVAALGSCSLLLFKKIGETQSELNVIVEPMITDMATSKWSKDVIHKYASPALKTWLIDHNMDNGMPGLSILGNMKKYNGITSFNASSSYASLVTEVVFDTGVAYISLQLSKENGKWLINNFNVNSPALLQNNVTGKPNAK